ncbi:type II toxin-antitoxin system VapC family toxin [Nocardioides carbamazepini]|uniref:type II toxin-antitoxin system VapC family toxin n=1 Tax=Nocardioides carbamazepini TaxID=2854259 RepID=UPI002149B591|nr:type II toxin-antitoxin system VapC family toxin [Nocardioides carbamazepini]
MIAVDTSALVAVVLGEPELERFSAILSRGPVVVSAATLTEAALVLHARQGADAVQDLRQLVARAEIDVRPVDAELGWAAHTAWERFGKGRHPAALNFGDCFSYALAKTLAVPLLFKGNDFAQTDLTAAV